MMSDMKNAKRIPLSNLPTPIHPLPRLSRELGKEIYVWRDDMTGFPESGNKIRKLEYLLGDAHLREATRIITCGGPQSNHARATAVAARRLGLSITLLLRLPPGATTEPRVTGNLLLDRMLGAEIRFIPYADYVAHGSKYDFFLMEAAGSSRARGETPYLIPEGGSNEIGILGYYHAVEEMLASWHHVCPEAAAPDSIITALGSGGTYAGLHLGLEARGLPASRLFAVNVCDDAEYFRRRIGSLFHAAAGIGLAVHDPVAQILDGHVGEGYARATEDELRFYCMVARKEGVILDPCYTGKAFRGWVEELRRDPARFGKRVLFLHSGGGFGSFAYEEQYAAVLR